MNTMKSTYPFRIVYIGPETPYADALKMQEQAVAEVLDGGMETLFFVEHHPVFTAGTSFQAKDVKDIGDIPLIHTGRGGNITYHGPGQRVVYPILDLTTRGRDIRQYVCNLQKWLQHTLNHYHIPSTACDDVGVWVITPDGSTAKIAAIGVRVRKWITFHGIALNIHPDMSAYTRITPCGIADRGVTCMAAYKRDITMQEVDTLLLESFPEFFPAVK